MKIKNADLKTVLIRPYRSETFIYNYSYNYS